MVSFEDDGIQQDDEPEEFTDSSYGYWTLRNMIRSEGLPLEERDRAVAEMERPAESGDMSVQYLMGKLLRDGPLLIPDSAKARRWSTLPSPPKLEILTHSFFWPIVSVTHLFFFAL